ncbi:MAG: type VI secretion system protein TssA [Acetobacteraceae bacterium]|nr:type VI secretion system protein TssA [Acetobacteraceae bacterium]
MADWPDGIDMEALLAPIADDAPAGSDLREDYSAQSTYYRLRDARSEARAAERQADADPAADPVLPPQWRQVRELAIKALSEQSKDLEVAAWLTEALVRLEGPRGLAAGAHLIAGLAEAFWDSNLYPVPDEDGIATLVAPVTGLNGEGGDGTLAQPLRKLALFRRTDGSDMPFWQYQQSEQLATIDATRAAQKIEAGVVPMETVENEARAAGQAHFATLRRDVQAAYDEWLAMGEVLDAKAGNDGPPTRAVRDLLDEVLAVARKYAPAEEAGASEQGGAYSEDAGGQRGAAGDGGSGSGAGGIARAPLAGAVSRDDMLKELGRIAEYFRRAEPQSPLAYTLEEAIRRGRMTWPELLSEIVSDVSVRDGILMQLGIRPPAAEAEEGGESSGGW